MSLWRRNDDGQKGSEGGRALALIPVGVALLFAGLMLPRAVPPRDLPLPEVNAPAVEAAQASDDARAAAAAETPLPTSVRAFGQAIRAFNVAEARDLPETGWDLLRSDVDRTRKEAMATGVGPLLDLRAAQMKKFLDGLHAWEKTGDVSPEFEAVAGAFLRRMTAAGWAHERTLDLSDAELRVMYKLKWNAVAHFEELPGFEPSLDEMRELYTFYLLHPHAPEGTRASIDAARKNARTAADCEALAAGEAMAGEGWRLEKIERLGRLDPSYPLDFARGVALYRSGNYEGSARAFESWLQKHPDGPWTLRARNHLRAALAEAMPR
jgi:hypothetical protein